MWGMPECCGRRCAATDSAWYVLMVHTIGERSLIFFRGQYSHAAIRIFDRGPFANQWRPKPSCHSPPTSSLQPLFCTAPRTRSRLDVIQVAATPRSVVATTASVAMKLALCTRGLILWQLPAASSRRQHNRQSTSSSSSISTSSSSSFASPSADEDDEKNGG